MTRLAPWCGAALVALLCGAGDARAAVALRVIAPLDPAVQITRVALAPGRVLLADGATALAVDPATRRVTVLATAVQDRPTRAATRVATAASEVAVLAFDRAPGRRPSRLLAGELGAPLALLEQAAGDAGGFVPEAATPVDGGVIVSERSLTDLVPRARLLTGDGSSRVLDLPATAAVGRFAGDLVAAVETDGDADVLTERDWRTGSVLGSVSIGGLGAVDLRPDGRVVAVAARGLVTWAPGQAPLTVLAARGTAVDDPRWAGQRIVVRRDLPAGLADVAVLDPGAARLRRLSPPSARLEIPAGAPDGRVAWVAGGCALVAHAADRAIDAVPSGPCPRIEAQLAETDQRLHGSRVRVLVRCVSAPTGCRGRLVLRDGGDAPGSGPVAGGADVRVPAGTARTVGVRLGARGLHRVRRLLARARGPYEGATLDAGLRTADAAGRVSSARATLLLRPGAAAGRAAARARAARRR